MKKAHLLLAVIGWLSAAFATTWYGLHLATGDSIPIVRMINYLAPWVSMWLLLLCLLNLITHRYVLAVLLLLPAMAIAYPFAPQFLPKSATYADAKIIKVMSYSKMGRNNDLESVAAVIMKEKPDILLMQEVGAKIFPLLSDLYDGDEVYAVRNRIGVLVSRFPFTALSGSKGSPNVAALNLPGATVTVWDVHLDKSFTSARAQVQGIQSILAEVRRTAGPVIVAGDFNATPGSEPYKLTNQVLKNAHAEAGFGFGFTFPSSARRMGVITPFMRIDHIFYNGYFSVIDAYVVKEAGGSDHYPIVAMMQFSKPPD